MCKYLDLRGISCPVNFVRCKLALEKLTNSETLKVDLDKGEPEEMVLPALKDEGYKIKVILVKSDWIRFIITSDAIR